MKYEKCVICKCQTHEKVETHIDARTCYEKGVGQLCFECFYRKAEPSEQQFQKGYQETMHDEDTGLLFIGWLILLTYITLIIGDLI